MKTRLAREATSRAYNRNQENASWELGHLDAATATGWLGSKGRKTETDRPTEDRDDVPFPSNPSGRGN